MIYTIICINHIYIYKEELNTVVRDILACVQPNCHKTYTALWNPYRRVSSRGRRAQIRFSRGARGEKPENDRPPFWFYGESIRTPCTVRTLLLWKRHLEMPLWELTWEIFMHVITKVTLMMFDDVPNSIIATMHSAAE